MSKQRGRFIQRQISYHDGFAHRKSRLLAGNRLRKVEIVQGLIDQWGSRQPQILEVGCGAGEWLSWLCQRNGPCLGIDASGEMLRLAREAADDRDVRWARAIAEQLPLAGDLFDVVLAVNTLHHVSDRSLAVAEIWRVLRPGGVAVAVETNGLNPLQILLAATNWRVESGTIQNLCFLQEKIFRRCGFQDVRTERRIFLPAGVRKGLFRSLERWLERTPLINEIAASIITTGRKA